MSIKNQSEKSLSLLRYVNQARMQGYFNDVVIKAGEKTFFANKLILSCFSKVLEKMFLTEMKERYSGTVEINEFDGEAVMHLLEFIYTGNIFIDSKNVINLLAAAHFLQLQEVIDLCFAFLKDSISIENWSTIYSAAEIYRNDCLLHHMSRFISENLREIVQTDDFKMLKVSSVFHIVQNLDRKLIKEVFIYEAVMSWIQHEEKNRKSELPKMFDLMELEKLPCEFLEDVVACDNLIKTNLNCINKVAYSITRQFKKMRMKESGSKLLRVGGFDTVSENATKVEEIYNLFSKKYPTLPYDLFFCCALIFQDFVYCIGGSMDKHSDETTNRVIRMNIKEMQMKWEGVASMTEKRALMGAARYENYVVVAGGLGNEKLSVNSVNIYDPTSDKWQQIAKLDQARCGHQLVACDESLFAIGGCNKIVDDNKYFTSVEKLTSLDEKWKNASSMNVSRAFFAAVNCNGAVYAIGGRQEHKDAVIILDSVEKLIPGNDTWTFVANMKYKRESHAACVMKGKIFVVGGVDEDDDVILTIECYDPKDDRWSCVGELEYGMFYHSLIAL